MLQGSKSRVTTSIEDWIDKTFAINVYYADKWSVQLYLQNFWQPITIDRTREYLIKMIAYVSLRAKQMDKHICLRIDKLLARRLISCMLEWRKIEIWKRALCENEFNTKSVATFRATISHSFVSLSF